MKDTTLSQHDLIDRYVPYLPVDPSTLKRCILAAYRKLGHQHVTDEDLDVIMEQLIDYPKEDKAFSSSGCRRVEDVVEEYLLTKRREL